MANGVDIIQGMTHLDPNQLFRGQQAGRQQAQKNTLFGQQTELNQLDLENKRREQGTAAFKQTALQAIASLDSGDTQGAITALSANPNDAPSVNLARRLQAGQTDQVRAFLGKMTGEQPKTFQKPFPVTGPGGEQQFGRVGPSGNIGIVDGATPPTPAGKGGLASAKTEIFDNGTIVAQLPDNNTQVTNPEGKIVTGEERLKVLKTAREEQIGFAGKKAEASALGKGSGMRSEDIINRGVLAGEGVAALRRGIELQKAISTGGIDRVRIAAKDLFGILEPDEGELSNLLGKAVLSQLRETFGAQFTVGEGNRLAAIEAGFSKNEKTNARLLGNALKIAERIAERGMERAGKTGDFQTAADIQASLEFTLGDAPKTLPATNAKGWPLMTDAQGNKAYVGPNNEVEEVQ